MSNVIAFPAKRPQWLYLVSGRLMVRADRPLADLHRMARLAGLPRAAYRRSSGVPCYRLGGRAVLRCVRIFGPMPCQAQILDAALELALRRRAKPPQQSTHFP